MNIEQEYTELIEQCEQLDYSDIDTILNTLTISFPNILGN